MAISPRWRAGAAALALGAAAGAALAQERPESILPPGFGQPAAPRPGPTPTAAPTPAAPVPAARPPAPGGVVVQPIPPENGTVAVTPPAGETPTPTPTPTPIPVDPAILAQYEMPLFARRSLDLIGPAGPREGALGPDAFGDAEGPYLETLMRRMSAPVPSRWLSIALRRLLAARLETPAGVGGADFAAERAWLLLRMGEADAARAVVQSVDDADYTPKLYQVAMNALLATGDPGGLCPLADQGLAATGETGWALAQAMCAGLEGDNARAKTLLTAARRQRGVNGIDLQLATKVVGTGPGGNQDVTIDWQPVIALSAWRIGLGFATGSALPAELLTTVGPQVRYWQALSPAIPLATRVAAAEAAAAQGVLSNAALVDFYGALEADDDAQGADTSVADDLTSAYADAAADSRLDALGRIWGSADRVPYARLVLTAHAAARIHPALGVQGADRLIASMLAAGLDRTAARWRDAVPAGSDGWAMLALADPDLTQRVSYRDLTGYAGHGDTALKQRLLFAGLAGLGRLAQDDVERGAAAFDVRIGAENGWTRAIDRAAAQGQPGTVILLAATGMQTASWQGVPPAMLYRIVAALRAVGLGGEARMIAAEAIARA